MSEPSREPLRRLHQAVEQGWLAAWLARATHDAEEVFGALDGDGDGVISAQEFARRGEASQDGGRTESVSPSRVLAASRYEMYRLMGLDAMASGQGTGFSATA